MSSARAPYLPFPIAHITAVALLIHLSLGCCWHHNPSCAMSRGDAPSAQAIACHHDSCQHDDRAKHESDDHPSSPDGRGSHKHPCQGEHCTFIVSKRMSEHTAELSYDLCVPGLSFCLAESESAEHCYCLALDQGAGAATAPLRAHLLFGVLLI